MTTATEIDIPTRAGKALLDGLGRYVVVEAWEEDNDRYGWLDAATCVREDIDPDSYFTPSGHVLDRELLEKCRACPVRVQCVSHAYDSNHPTGYFGGLSSGRRERMTKEQALAFIAEDKPGSSRRRPIPVAPVAKGK